MKNLKSILSFMMVFVMLLQCQVTTLVAIEDTGYTDIEADAWYADSVKYCTDNNLMSGTSAGIFSPEAAMSRAMLATVLYRMSGSPTISGSHGFSDVSNDAWYTNAVAWAVKNEIVAGYGSGLFGTNDPVTREQIVTILWRYSESPTISANSSGFSDATAISAYAIDAVNWAHSFGIVSGKIGNIFDPNGNVTRAEVSKILQNYLTTDQPLLIPAPVPEATPTPVPLPEASPTPVPEAMLTPIPTQSPSEDSSVKNLSITINGLAFTIRLYDNDTTRELLEQLPMTLNMSELNGNEKFYYLPNGLPTNSQRIGSINAGDLMLYGSDCLVLFYESFTTSYNYTKLGYVEDVTGLVNALGSGSVQVIFNIKE